ncbi:hypothetical protein WICANDRAFT_60673 [Wickerhamomyces anomalus NRRL Y-366-8]|uniref:Conserved oligomeric Golgi complex subunit 8 n=1 Tax=Wickerhamomyces anomalus (strain ATCC 58044 / CBS 1984 / NCYC 433 / NRRL Y-366-8) TaxID=683960 RepID=A0A1E3PB15_WICAA|nr:uncharacterized protein WICANDRAFT_60673 [Wickerhamomyces anomalus NRRL Y-366-8]ODQ62615.1 hypothetical protein WICANDRAFT_60673 [Wickerhamomyces anomalus NRRL Y-366-8]
MTEVENYDASSLEVLLQELSDDLPSEIQSLLESPALHSDILKYLNDISSIESNDYLSSIPPTPAANRDGNIVEERTLVQDIAELEANQRSIDSKLKNLIIKSQGSIIENEIGLKDAYQSFDTEFAHNAKSLWRTFKDDDIDEIKDDQDQELQELEFDLDPTTKQDTFYQTISNIKNTQLNETEKHKNLSIVLDNMDQILNVLELPSLAGACIKAGYYSEALEISSYTRRLAIRFPNSDLVKEVEAGVKSEMSMMLTGLIRLLRTNLKQSSIIKILSYLRRIQPFSQSNNADEQLKRILLHSRYEFIKLELSSLLPLRESALHEKYLKRSIEVIREFCFGSIMTYKSIFADIDDFELEDVKIELEEVEQSEEQIPKVEKEEEVSTQAEASETKANNAKEEGDAAEKEFNDESKLDADSKDQKVEEGSEDNKEEDVPADSLEQKQDENKQTEQKDKSTDDADELKELKEPTPEKPIIKLLENRKQSNILLFEFVRNVLIELIQNLKVSLLEVHEKSIRDGLYLQLIYCSQSLGRIDENFSDLMTVTLLNAKDENSKHIIDRESWAVSIQKQQQLAKSLNR